MAPLKSGAYFLAFTTGHAFGWSQQFTPHCRRTSALRSTSFDPSAAPPVSLYDEQQKALIRRGEIEIEMMSHFGLLEPPTLEVDLSAIDIAPKSKPLKKKPPTSRGGGFAAGAKKKKRKVVEVESEPLPMPPAEVALGRARAAVLREEGCLRVNRALSPETAAAVRAFVLAERKLAREAIEAGTNNLVYFSDVLLSDQRCDLMLPLGGAPPVAAAMQELFGPSGTMRALLQELVGDDSTLYELASLVSEPGASRQRVHPDAPYQEHAPLYTCFVAVQDINEHMGPTTFVPRTNTAAAHERFGEFASPARDEMLRTVDNRVALLGAGDLVIFDSRTLHCGGGNDPERGETRALFYFSFTNPAAATLSGQNSGNVASMRAGYVPEPLTLRRLCCRLDGAGADAKLAADPFVDLGDGLGAKGKKVLLQREAWQRGRKAPQGAL